MKHSNTRFLVEYLGILIASYLVLTGMFALVGDFNYLEMLTSSKQWYALAAIYWWIPVYRMVELHQENVLAGAELNWELLDFPIGHGLYDDLLQAEKLLEEFKRNLSLVSEKTDLVCDKGEMAYPGLCSLSNAYKLRYLAILLNYLYTKHKEVTVSGRTEVYLTKGFLIEPRLIFIRYYISLYKKQNKI